MLSFLTRRATPVLLTMLGMMAITAMSPAHARGVDDALIDTVKKVEQRLEARLGIYVNDLSTQRTWAYRANERFPLNSTFKAFACAALLARVDAAQEQLDHTVVITKDALVDYAPVTEKSIGTAMTMAQLCHAAITLSDNTAANIIMERLGGPKAFTQFMRAIGDQHTRIDRYEPELNTATPDDLRDTTTPAAAARSLQTLLSGNTLTPASRAQLEDWLINDAVATQLLRAALPHAWVIGDKTGAGGYGSRGIIAIIRIPGRAPVFTAIYLTQTKATMDERNAAIAEIGAALVNTLAGTQ